MRAKLLVALGTSVAGAAAVALIVTIADRAWTLHIVRVVGRLRDGGASIAKPFSLEELVGLPPPVARYLTYALRPGQPIVCGARLWQAGTFAMHSDAWTRFAAIEYFSTSPPGFLWDARIRTRAVTTYVRDGYLDGAGALYATIAGLIPVANVRATPGIAAGELLRYLAEAVFIPTALLPRDGVSWSPIDATSARVTLTDRTTRVSAVVDFGPVGEIARISAMRA